MFNNHLMKACLAAVFAIGLAACSSSSDNGSAGTTDPMPTQEEQQLAALQQEIAALRAQLGLDADDDIGDSITALMAERDRLQKQIDDAADEAERKAAEAAAAAMAATAAKLYAGVSAPSGDPASPAATDRAAAYNTDADAIMVSIGNGTDTPTPVTLSEDKDAMVADNAGWEGKRYTRTTPAADGMYEAVVYSNVGDPMAGDKFGQIGVGTPVTGYEYGLSATGQLAVDTSSTAAYVDLVDSSSFDHSAGVKRFPLPDPNPGQATVVNVPGTFHGVSGTYSCTPGATVCAANVSGDGFQLGTVPSATDATFTDGGGTWMFRPTNPEARVMDVMDDAYASYGWWIHKAANDGAFTASAFVDEKGTVADAAGLNDLNGTATYQGGAAGKYALASSTGGTNDAGHFTARATLQADFTNNTDATSAITGTIDQFIGADGKTRDWSVKLNASAIGDTGAIGLATATEGTEWTIGGTAAADAGQWSGNLRNNGADGVPQVATGTFYTMYGTAGKMVGAFGANKQ